MSKKIFRRGQVMVFWALLMPILIVLLGLGMDLGWYYLTVSRLQNAADAAVVAGAYKLVEQTKFSNYFVKVLTNPPGDITQYEQIRFNTVVENLNMEDGEAEAKRYSGENLGHTTEGKVFDDWNTSSDENKREVTLSAALYAKTADAQWDENGIRYYRVTLKEDVTHLFLRNFEPMEAVVTSYALLHPHDVDLMTVIKQLEDTKVIANWQYQNTYKDFEGKWNHYRQTSTNNAGSSGQKTISYVAGEYFRTETINVEKATGDQTNSGFKSGTGNYSSLFLTPANGKRNYDETEVDALNIDFNQDISTQFSEDWDLGASTTKKIGYITNAMDGWDANNGADLRIQGLINFRDAWKNRNLMDEDTSNDLTPDPLWVRIESDPWWSTKAALPWLSSNTSNGGWNSVHQMIISIDKSNTGDTTKAYNSASGEFDGYSIEGGKAYKYRPFFIFYQGPETYVENNSVRQSQPVILNLNADWNGILYAPNSPVVILGNQKKLTGFVIAKDFVKLAEKTDYTSNGYNEYQDLNGKPIFVKPEDISSGSELRAEYPEDDYKITESDDGKTFSVYKYERIPKYFIVDPRYVKGEAGATEESYVESLKHYRNLTADKIVQIKFENDGYNNTQSYSVAKDDLLEEDPDPVDDPDPTIETPNIKSPITAAQDQYVKVITSDNEVRYIAKTNLPYVKTFRDKYFYVPVCDIKTKKTASNIYEGYYAGVTIANDDDTDSYTDSEKDTWKVFRNSLSVYEGYVSSKIKKKTEEIEIEESDGDETTTRTIKLRYFTINSEETTINKKNQNPPLVATYKKIGEDIYVTDGFNAYYTYYKYKTNSQDPISGSAQKEIELIMDNKGNVQTKALDDGSYFKVHDVEDNYEFQPDDKGWNKKILNQETYVNDKDYRLPEYERIYHKSAFNLSEDSCYSYFQIPSLHRKNYTYLNVDELNEIPGPGFSSWSIEDMFFLTRRANWID